MGDNADAAIGAPEPTPSEVARLAAERDRLRAEVDDLRAQVPPASPRRAGRPRRIVTALLVVLTSIVFTVAVVGAWAHRNVLNTDKWVETVGPIVEDPAVQQSLGNWMTAELMGAIDPEAFFESVLQIGEASPEIFGRTVDLPEVTVDDIPEDAVAKVESALGRDLPDDFGQFTVFDAQQLEAAQDAVALFDRFVVAAAVLAVVLIALTLGVSPYRRRTLLQLAVGIALGVVLLRRIGIRVEDEVVDLAKPENREAVGVVVGAFVDSLLDATAWILAAAALVAVVALLTGPYGWARALRRRTVSVAHALAAAVRSAVTQRPDEATVAWVVAHRELLQIGGIVAGILVLLVVDLSWLGILLLALVIGGFELAVARIAALAPARADPGVRGGGPLESGLRLRSSPAWPTPPHPVRVISSDWPDRSVRARIGLTPRRRATPAGGVDGTKDWPDARSPRTRSRP